MDEFTQDKTVDFSAWFDFVYHRIAGDQAPLSRR
jgi:hypothetical protein